MLNMIKRFFHEGQGKALKDRLDSSMALKFMAAVTVVICVFMSIGTFLITTMLMRGEYRALEASGRDMGLFLGKALTEPLLRQDRDALDGLVAEAVKSHDVLYAYVTDSSNVVQNNVAACFNRTHDGMRDLLAQEKTASVQAIVAKAKERFDPIEVPVDIQLTGTRIGTTTIGFSRSGIQQNAWQTVRKLLVIGVFIIAGLALTIYLVVRKMIVSTTTEIVGVVSNIATGDLSQRVKVRTTDEFGSLGRGLNRMAVELKGMIERRQRWQRINADVSYFEEAWKPKVWDCRFRFLFIRTRALRQHKEPLQLDLFIPHETGYDFKVILTNKTLAAGHVVAYHEGRGSQEGILGELKSHCQMGYVPVRRRAGNQLYLLAGLFAHNLMRELQMATSRPCRHTTPQRAALWTFEKLDTFRQTLLHRAGRLTRPQGILTLTLNANHWLRHQFLTRLSGLRRLQPAA